MIVTLQIVNYKSLESLQRCLESVAKSVIPGITLEIILINNEAEPLSYSMLPGNLPAATEIIEAKTNLGFGTAHNLGLQRAKGEFILLLNPDTEVQENVIAELVGVFNRDPEVGIAGPLLVGKSGRVEEEHSIIYSKLGGEKPYSGKNVFEVDWISGGAMMIRKELLSELGGFDKKYFVYFEDVDLCLRAKSRKAKIVVNPRAIVVHESGKSFESAQEKKRYYYASQNYYLRKNFGALPAAFVKLVRLPLYIKNVYFGR
jgi:GT2 family glycosyltransferase